MRAQPGSPNCLVAARACVRLPVLVLLAMLLALAVPTAASAHAVLEGTSPGQGATTKSGPGHVTLSYNEDVKVAFGAVRVFGPDGSRVDSGKATSRDHVVSVPVNSGATGTWAVSWRVISADGHPIRGAYTFDVGHASGGDALAKAKAASKSSTAKDWSFSLIRALVLLGLALGAGGGFFAAVIAPGWRPRFAIAGLVLTIVVLAIGLALDASIAGGFSIGSALRIAVLREEVQATWGRAAVIRAVLALVCLVVLLAWRRIGRWMAGPDGAAETASRLGARHATVALPFVLLAASQSLSGHAIATHPVWLRLPADALHAVAAALWIGGLVQLGLSVRRGLPARSVHRFSRMAMLCVITIVVTGLYAAYAEIGFSWAALVTTAYGRLVIAKVLLLIAVLPIANVNRTRHVPSLGELIDGEEGAMQASGRSGLARYAWGELGVLVIVLAITGILVGEPPARTTVAAKPISVSKTFSDGSQMQVEIEPATTGKDDAHLYLLTAAGRQDTRATDMSMELTNNKRGLGPLRIDLTKAGPGHWTAPSFTIPFDGNWTVDVTVTLGEFDQRSARFHGDVSAARAG